MRNRIKILGFLALSYLLIAVCKPVAKVGADNSLVLSVWSLGADFLSNTSQTTETPSIYAVDPNDAWNRIFVCLFTRTFKARLSDEFKEGAPFKRIEYNQYPHELYLSTRLFERVELGDRGIEPLYPSFITSQGISYVLSEPIYSQLEQALTQALAEERVRPPLDRALMQSDIWAAYDLIYAYTYKTGTDSERFRAHSDQLLPLLARLIKKLALTPKEIELLPDNYTAAANSNHLPKLFDQGSGWLEVQWSPDREHDRSAGYRRETRVFIKPASLPPDKSVFLNSLRNAPDAALKLNAVALVTRNLLVDSGGTVVPSRLTYNVQLRQFIKDSRGVLIKTEVQEYEFNRQLLLRKPSSGGLFGLDEEAPIYLPEAGNDYGFASLQRQHPGHNSPILVTLRSRCVACHGHDLAAVFTFSSHLSKPFSPVNQLNPLGNEHAFYVANRKMQREDFRALQGGVRQRRN